MGTFVDHAILADLVRHVLLCVHDELHLIRDVFFLDLRRDLRRLAGRELSVHDRAADPKTLLTTRLPASVESRAVQEATEYVRHLLLHDSGPVVFDDDEEFVLVHLAHFNEDVGGPFPPSVGARGVLAASLTPGGGGFRSRAYPRSCLFCLAS